MKTTLGRLITELDFDSFDKIISNIGTDNPDKEVSILQILNSNGIRDAILALQTQKYKDYCLFNADVAESVLYLFEEKYPNDMRPRKVIEGVRLFHAGKITGKELEDLRKDAEAAGVAGYGYHGICYYTAIFTAESAVDAICYCTKYVNSFKTVRGVHNKKWEEIEIILRKHLRENLLDDSLFVI